MKRKKMANPRRPQAPSRYIVYAAPAMDERPAKANTPNIHASYNLWPSFAHRFTSCKKKK